jgi:hypothetical protein
MSVEFVRVLNQIAVACFFRGSVVVQGWFLDAVFPGFDLECGVMLFIALIEFFVEYFIVIKWYFFVFFSFCIFTLRGRRC